jgi:hypothetical protein
LSIEPSSSGNEILRDSTNNYQDGKKTPKSAFRLFGSSKVADEVSLIELKYCMNSLVFKIKLRFMINSIYKIRICRRNLIIRHLMEI